MSLSLQTFHSFAWKILLLFNFLPYHPSVLFLHFSFYPLSFFLPFCSDPYVSPAYRFQLKACGRRRGLSTVSVHTLSLFTRKDINLSTKPVSAVPMQELFSQTNNEPFVVWGGGGHCGQPISTQEVTGYWLHWVENAPT